MPGRTWADRTWRRGGGEGNMGCPLSFVAAQTFGVTFMVGAMHNFVRVFPEPFVWLFSEDWVAFTLEYSEFRTIRYMGYLFPF